MFIVADMRATLDFYCDRLGFELTYAGEDPADPYFTIVQRDNAMIMFKHVDVAPLSNPARDRQARWDAYVHVPDPDALAAEWDSRGVSFRTPLGDNSDDLRGFEVEDVNGYVFFYGRPNS